MGWTFTYRGSTPIKEFLINQINCENESGCWKVLDIAIVKFRTAYMAVEMIRRNQRTGEIDMATKKIVAFVFLLDFRPLDHCDIGYKDMDESMGPFECECPERILSILTPTEHEYAREWREQCWKKIAGRKRLKQGAIVTTTPIPFLDGKSRSQFQVISLRPLLLRCMETNVKCKISRKVLENQVVTVAVS